MCTEDMPLDELGGIQAFVPELVVDATNVAIVREEDGKRHQPRYRKYGIVGALCLTIAIVAVAVPVSLTQFKIEPEDKEFVQTPDPTFVATSFEYLQVVAAVSDAGVSSRKSLEDATTYQHKAAHWLANEDPTPLRPLRDDSGGRSSSEIGYSHRFLQRYILAAFYFATDGDNWEDCSRKKQVCTRDNRESWLTGTDECFWYGVWCKDSNNDAKKLLKKVHVHRNNLKGPLIDELSHLPVITELLLPFNDIYGKIPHSFGNLTKMSSFIMTNCNLEGPIPDDFLDGATQLCDILLAQNKFEGPVPDFARLPKLRDLRLKDNTFTGSIPLGLAHLPLLKILELDGNNLNGTLSDEFFAFPKLESLVLHENDISGSLPTFVGQLQTIQTFDVAHNEMTGSVPAELFSLPELEQLILTNNSFVEALPSNIGNATGLQVIYLEANKFMGPLPDSISNLTNLRQLMIHDNEFVGPIPPGLCERRGTNYFDLTVFVSDCSEVNCTCCSDCPGAKVFEL